MRKCDICSGDNTEILLDNLSFLNKAKDDGKVWKYRLMKCRGCGLNFVDPKPSFDQLCLFYDVGYACYVTNRGNESFGKGSLKYRTAMCRYASHQRKGLRESALTAFGVGVEWITGRTVSFSLGIPLQLSKDAYIFEIGYGSGSWLLSMVNIGYAHLAGYDIEANRDNVSRLESKGVAVSGGDFLENDYAINSYDCIRMEHVLEHLLQPREVLSKCYKMLRPGGILVLNLPCIDSWLARLSIKSLPDLDIPRHLYHYTPQSATLLLKSLGFEMVDVKPYAVPTYIAAYMNAALARFGLGRVKISVIMTMPFAPIYKLFCLLTHKGDYMTILCKKRISQL